MCRTLGIMIKKNAKKNGQSSMGIGVLSMAAAVIGTTGALLSSPGLNAAVTTSTAGTWEITSCRFFDGATRTVSADIRNNTGTSQRANVTFSVTQETGNSSTLIGTVNVASPVLGNGASTNVSTTVRLANATYILRCCIGTVCQESLFALDGSLGTSNSASSAAATTAAVASRAAPSAPANILGSADLDLLSPFAFTRGATSDTFGITVKNIGDASTQFKPGQSAVEAVVTIANVRGTVVTKLLRYDAFAPLDEKSAGFVQQPRLPAGAYTLSVCVNSNSSTVANAVNVVETALANNCDVQPFVIQDASSSSAASSTRPPVVTSSAASACRATLTCAACIRQQCRTVQVVPSAGVTSCEGMNMGLEGNLASCTATCGSVKVDVDGVTRTCS